MDLWDICILITILVSINLWLLIPFWLPLWIDICDFIDRKKGAKK